MPERKRNLWRGRDNPRGPRHGHRAVDEGSEIRAELEDTLGLGENRAGGRRFAEREMGSYEIEPDLHGEPGKTVIEQRPQTVGVARA